MVAPTIGELDAAYNLLKLEQIPIAKGEISNFSKKVAERYFSLTEEEQLKENKIIFYFHSKPITGKQEDEYSSLCKDLGLTFLHNMVIYQLIDQYKETKKKFLEERKKENSEKGKAIFPCELQILKDHVYMKGGNDDLLFGIKVRAGRLLKGTPIITEKKVKLGKVTSIQKNHKEISEAKLRDEVCIRIKNESNISFGRQFASTDKLISELSRDSIDELKLNFRDEMEKSDWKLVIEHMSKLDISKK